MGDSVVMVPVDSWKAIQRAQRRVSEFLGELEGRSWQDEQYLLRGDADELKEVLAEFVDLVDLAMGGERHSRHERQIEAHGKAQAVPERRVRRWTDFPVAGGTK